ncbi:MAG TPA: hypothetical protein VKV95_11135 [Terriglobia bacterium]|nr:hypothetical protein [Terriglobia bacterium]
MNQFRVKFLALIVIAGMWSRVYAIPTSPPRVDVSPMPQKSDLQSQLATADAVLEEMSKTTGLPIKGPLKKAILPRPAIEKYLIENLHAESTPEELRVQEATLKAFGLVSSDFDLEKFLITFYTEQVAGFYDPRTKTMNMADWIPSEMQSMVLSHELTHALQDQNYDLDKFLHGARDNDDATNARQAIVEGHAMAAMMQHALGQVDLGAIPSLSQMMAGVVDEQLSAFPAFSHAPFFFRMQALFPYLQGMSFMQKGLARGGWKELNGLFMNPPATTKELFEPELYFNHTHFPVESLPKPPPLSGVPSLHFLTENTMGELGYYSIIGQLLSEDQAKSAGLAWLADRYLLYEYSGKTEGGGNFVLVSRTKWSNAEKSLEFFRDYNTILQRKYPGLSPDARSGSDLFIAGAGSSRVIVLRRGDEVLWAEGIPAAQADAILDWLRGLKD